MDAATLFENTMASIRNRGFHRFSKEAEIVLDAKARIERAIAEDGLPYRVAKERMLIGGRADLAILGPDGDSVPVAVEFKYERSHEGDDVVFWSEVEADIQKIQKYVAEGGVGAAYAILIDADGRWFRRHPNAPEGSAWRDWGNGVSALWTQRSRGAYKAPPAGAADDAPLPASVEIAEGACPLPEWDMSDIPRRARLNKTLVFPDGDRARLGKQGDLLVETTRWLWAKGHLTSDKLPVPSGPIRYIVNTAPFHSNKGGFESAQEIEGTPLIVEAFTADRKEAVRFAIKLLEHCGVDPNAVLVLR